MPCINSCSDGFASSNGLSEIAGKEVAGMFEGEAADVWLCADVVLIVAIACLTFCCISAGIALGQARIARKRICCSAAANISFLVSFFLPSDRTLPSCRPSRACA